MKDYDEEDKMVQDRILDSGSAVFEVVYLLPTQIEFAKDYDTSWYRSKGKRGGNHPFASFMLNKKWTLQEEFNNHMLRFHKVTVQSVLFILV